MHDRQGVYTPKEVWQMDPQLNAAEGRLADAIRRKLVLEIAGLSGAGLVVSAFRGEASAFASGRRAWCCWSSYRALGLCTLTMRADCAKKGGSPFASAASEAAETCSV